MSNEPKKKSTSENPTNQNQQELSETPTNTTTIPNINTNNDLYNQASEKNTNDPQHNPSATNLTTNFTFFYKLP